MGRIITLLLIIALAIFGGAFITGSTLITEKPHVEFMSNVNSGYFGDGEILTFQECNQEGRCIMLHIDGDKSLYSRI